MNEIIKTFNNPEFGGIRAMKIDGEPWFAGKDVAASLGYSNTKDALISHVDEEDKRIIQRSEIATLENNIPQSVLPVNFVSADIPNRGLTIINESGLYSLILSSKLPNAKAFKRWITSEVIPSIRKHGTYTMKDRKPDPSADKRATAMLLNAKTRVANQMKNFWDAAGIKPQYQALAMNNFYDGLEVPRIAFNESATVLYDATTIATRLGIMAEKSGKPHAQAVTAIISQLSISPDEQTETPYSRNGHDGVSMQYAESVVGKVAAWLEENQYPKCINGNGKQFRVTYQAAAESR